MKCWVVADVQVKLYDTNTTKVEREEMKVF